ncbi:MAG TPA: tRNA (cytidine(56)-2'-O)-methyltransferase [Nitrososphaera sp.]|jgi:tRNA (cytidine56-2'-O)-methyltransferase|nr:tRNA (cytidine(56)-2'-O)-methyltransferase [Nitrososphaera sp.]
MRVHVLRIGHRLVRDDRVTTHAALVARAFGAEKIYMTGIDQSVAETVSSIGKRWGGSFEVETIDDWKSVAKQWKKDGGTIAHLTMYGVNIDKAMKTLRTRKNILVIIGSEKVPREAYDLADHNVAVGNQPHSEIAALAIFLDRIFRGKQLGSEFSGGRLKIVPSEKGKVVQEIK